MTDVFNLLLSIHDSDKLDSFNKNGLKIFSGHDGKHDDSLSVKIQSSFHDPAGIVLHLTRSDENHPKSLIVRTYDAEGNPKHDEIQPDNCYYSGSVLGKRDSFVHLSTCGGGLLGTVDDGERVFDIEPHGDDGAHRFANVDDVMRNVVSRLQESADLPKREWHSADPSVELDEVCLDSYLHYFFYKKPKKDIFMEPKRGLFGVIIE